MPYDTLHDSQHADQQVSYIREDFCKTTAVVAYTCRSIFILL